jgi:hypothetical protein
VLIIADDAQKQILKKTSGTFVDSAACEFLVHKLF